MTRPHAPPLGAPGPRVAFGGHPDLPRALVVVFLRGGADGLALVPPVGDAAYHRARPTLAVRPGRGDVAPLGSAEGAGFFALHPGLHPLRPLGDAGALAVIHAVGSDDGTRSHFAAQDRMELGAPNEADGNLPNGTSGAAGGGWLGRYLRARAAAGDAAGGGALAAVALGTRLPLSLRGAPAATVLRTLDDLALVPHAGPLAGALPPALARLYAGGGASALDAAVRAAGRDALGALARIDAIRGSSDRPSRLPAGADYPNDDFGGGLRTVARLLHARVGVRAATIDLGGWDSHVGQALLLPGLVASLGAGLAAFAADLGPLLATTTVVVMTEFGRRVAENAGQGTDHGRASAMFVLGGALPAAFPGGQVTARWPGLTADVLDGPGDLAVTTDYREVLGHVLRQHAPDVPLAAVFPGWGAPPRG